MVKYPLSPLGGSSAPSIPAARAQPDTGSLLSKIPQLHLPKLSFLTLPHLEPVGGEVNPEHKWRGHLRPWVRQILDRGDDFLIPLLHSGPQPLSLTSDLDLCSRLFPSRATFAKPVCPEHRQNDASEIRVWSTMAGKKMGLGCSNQLCSPAAVWPWSQP